MVRLPQYAAGRQWRSIAIAGLAVVALLAGGSLLVHGVAQVAPLRHPRPTAAPKPPVHQLADAARQRAAGSDQGAADGVDDLWTSARRAVTAAALGLVCAVLLTSPGVETPVPVHSSRQVNLVAPAWAARGTFSAGDRANKDPIALLGAAVPLEEALGEKQAAPVREVQARIEEAKEYARKRLFKQADDNIDEARKLLQAQGANFVKMADPSRQADTEAAVKKLIQALDQALTVDVSAASIDEPNKALDEGVEKVQRVLLDLQEDLVPPSFSTPVFEQVDSKLPRLQGRAEVEVTFKRGPTPLLYNLPDGKQSKEMKITVECDGWTAPITAGNWVDLVDKKVYDGLDIKRADGFVVECGDTGDAQDHGYKPAGSDTVRRIPLEISLQSRLKPYYGATVDDMGKVGAPTRLPFQATGAIAMGRDEMEPDTASSQFFWFLFESDLTPAGKNFLDGRYATFGYTVDNPEMLRQVKEGDVVTSMKVVKGLDNLKR